MEYLSRTGNPYYIPCLVAGVLSVMAWIPEFLKVNKF